MSAKRLRIDEQPSSYTLQQTTDWTLCMLCQTKSTEVLRNPDQDKPNSQPTGYATLAKNLKDLHDLNSLPYQIDLCRLGDRVGLEETFIQQKAKYHKTCYVNCNKQKVERIRKKNAKSELLAMEPGSPIKGKLRRAYYTSTSSESQSKTCFFCDKTVEEYHTAATPNFNDHIIKMSTDLRDSKLLAKLAAGDMTATNSVYHKLCVTRLSNRHRSMKRKEASVAPNEQMEPEHIALAELVSYVEDTIKGFQNPVMKLSELVAMYKSRLQQLGAETSNRVNNTRLKEKLLAQIPGLEAHNSKYEVILSFRESTGDTLLKMCQQNQDDDAVILMRAAQIVRKDIFNTQCKFTGSLLDDNYENRSPSLDALVQMILAGTNLQSQTEIGKDVKTATSSITQLLTFNAIKRSRKDSQAVRHNPERETRLPLYLGLLVYTKTRKRELVDTLFQHGLSVSYSRIIQLSTNLANSVLDHYNADGTVCPTAMRNGLFTTGNLDNIDHNPSATSTQTSFHGTAISITQHPTHDNEGTERIKTKHMLSSESSKILKPLPEAYVHIPPAKYPSNTPMPQRLSGPRPTRSTRMYDEKHKVWLKKVNTELQKENPDITNISWSAHFANDQRACLHPPAITGLMPLFRDSAHSLAMVKHGMNLVRKATDLVNPGQIPILTVDQPLYAIAKKIQWSWPESYGAEKYLVFMGGLHIEMAFLKVLGDWLDGSGWVAILTNANVSTEGRADALKKGSSTTRSQWAHQVTASALYCLQNQAYQTYCEALDGDDQPPKPYDEWCAEMSTIHPQFAYWTKVLELQTLLLQFMGSQREGDFTVYLESLYQIVPWMFLMDHFHYARWLSVHIRDLEQLQKNCPEVWNELSKGHFVTQKTGNLFSMMAHDQIHEQQNAVVKGDGGLVGITENETALRRFMVAGPETARVISEVEKRQTGALNSPHHEQIPSTQRRFTTNVQSLVKVFNEMGNPFTETSSDLMTMDTKIIMSDEVVEGIRKAPDMGRKQHEQFVEQRLEKMTQSFYDTVSKNSLPLFKTGHRKSASKSKAKLSTLKSDLQLFSRMYISCQSRDGQIDKFFEHENHAWPPSLAESNSMRTSNKADLLKCLEPLVTPPESTPDVDAKVFDGAALVHTLDPKYSPTEVKTFRQYADQVFMPYLLKQLQSVSRVDIVWDSYSKNSMKTHTRECRGGGDALRVSHQTRIPRSWQCFLRVTSNKVELFEYLAMAIVSTEVPQGKALVTTRGKGVATSSGTDVSTIQPCTQEEADHRMMLHCAHAHNHGHHRIMVHATDTDVVVIAVAVSIQLPSCELWIAFGHGDKFRFIAVHAIAASLGPEMSQGLPFMHAISGCDTVSSMCGIGKKTAWHVWKSLPDINQVFNRLSHTPENISVSDVEQLERYVVLLYSRTSDESSVNVARKHLFCHGNRKIENIPPSSSALLQHIKRAAFQAGHIWGQALVAKPTLPSPADWGWQVDPGGQWTPLWSTLPEAAKSCTELVKCNCKQGCLGRCQCRKVNLQCTQLCFCEGQCSH